MSNKACPPQRNTFKKFIYHLLGSGLNGHDDMQDVPATTGNILDDLDRQMTDLQQVICIYIIGNGRCT